MRRRRGSNSATTRPGYVPPAIEYITDGDGAFEACRRAAMAGMYALDTEFHRERTYYPKLALLQLHWKEHGKDVNVLVDPLAMERFELANALTDLLESPATALMHAASQDLEILELLTGRRPSVLFDCQLAAGFLGYSTPSLATLANATVGVELPKGERLTDWLARPLSDDQRVYAANDVVHLPQIAEVLRGNLERRSRLPWALEACETLRRKPVAGTDPTEAWKRIKEARALKGEALGAMQALAEWRDLRARALDVPVRRVLADMALVSIAQKLPRNADELARVRGVTPGQLREETIDGILDAVAQGRARRPVGDRVARGVAHHSRTTATVLNAWVGELARREEIDPMLVATREDVENFLERGPDAIPDGWRRELVGNDFRKLVEGRAGLVLDAAGRLRLVELPAGAV
jgi:ribonuclease D